MSGLTKNLTDDRLTVSNQPFQLLRPALNLKSFKLNSWKSTEYVYAVLPCSTHFCGTGLEIIFSQSTIESRTEDHPQLPVEFPVSGGTQKERGSQ